MAKRIITEVIWLWKDLYCRSVGGHESIGRVTLYACTVLLVFIEYFLLTAVRDGIFDYTMDIWYDLQWLLRYNSSECVNILSQEGCFWMSMKIFNSIKNNEILGKCILLFPKSFQNSTFFVLLGISRPEVDAQTELCAVVVY